MIGVAPHPRAFQQERSRAWPRRHIAALAATCCVANFACSAESVATFDAGSADASTDGSVNSCGIAGLVITGDPTSVQGASWVYSAQEEGVTYNLAGTLLKPSSPAGSTGKYPAVVLNHATGGSAVRIAQNIGQQMRSWGLVAIAVNLTHAKQEMIPSESPGTFGQDLGASEANILRARKCIDILSSLCYVDMTRVAAHGHSRGAFVTAGFAGTYPTVLKAASHTSGGVNDAKVSNGWTSSNQATAIAIPYQQHHGEDDTTVPLADEQALESIMASRGVVHELWTYPGHGHNIASLPEVMDRIKTWYTAQGVLR